MYRQIMVPLDGSRFAESVLPIALSLSRRTGAPLHVVTVQEPIPSFAYDEWESAAGEWSEEYLRSVVERFGSQGGGEVTTRLLTGHVVESLEEEAEARSADLVVMATHGRGAFSRAWLGSVTDAFLHHTERPVLLVRPDEDAEASPPTDFAVARILVPLDGTDVVLRWDRPGPVSIQYNQDVRRLGNLANQEGLPAVPFGRREVQ